MKRAFSGFTLIELLVVIAIIAILAAILFPVFSQAKAAAKQTQAITNSKQNGTAVVLYLADNDDRYPLAFFSNTYRVDGPTPDSNVHYAYFNYIKNVQVWTDPMNSASETQRITQEMFYTPTNVGAGFGPQQRVFNLGLKSDFGVNTQFIHPQGWNGSRTFHHPISQTEVASPSKTIYSISSVWNRSSSGTPYGGGNYEVDAPCIYDTSFRDLRPNMGQYSSYWWFGGWNPSSPFAWNVFGGVWPWHGTKVIVTYADTSTKIKPITAVAAGCNVENGHGGTAFNLDLYEWDITQ
jgi:prepilin-type N-terminal cleavage/methylation domain-containing protein